MKRALLFLFCALISTQMFSESSSPYGTATSFAKIDVASTTFNNDIEDISSDLRKKYLVEKITWYDDETNHKEAYYEYDNNNRLVRRIIHNTYFEQGRVKHDTIVDNYEYTEGNLTKISYKDVYVSYTYDLEYDNAGRLITSKYGNNIMHFCYRGGKMDSIWYDNDPECYTILKYDEHGNIVKEINRVPEMDDIWGEYPTGNYVFRENEYEYDDKIRPFFNIDNAFVYDPIFGQGTTHSEYVRMLSTNNLIKYSRSSWHYTYNEEGLPIELRSRFEGVTPVNDPKYVFTYRKIEKTESLADLFPTLWGLQRTGCTKTIGENGNGTTVWGSRSYLMQEIETATIDGKQYLLFGTNNIYDEYCSLWLREENNKILVYSTAQKKDLVLYDFTLNVGDSLSRLYVDYELSSVVDYFKYEADWEYTKPLFVTEVSTITLLDGKEYKKWTFDNGIEYVEGIGSFGSNYGHNDFYQLIVNAPRFSDVYSQHLVCASKNGQLLYQMDEAEMERLGTECLCEVETSYKSQWCDTWNVFVENGSVYPPHEETYRYQLAQDTVIGEHTYTAVVSKAINDAFDAPRYVAAVRFTDDRKVYIYYDNAEYLLYDFNVQEGDELEVFAGINNYTSEIKTYKCTVTGVEQYACVGCPATITLEVHNHPDDFREFYRQTQWIEGVGDINGFLNGINGYINIPGNAAEYLLCAYQGDELKYTGDLYEEYGCGDNANDPQLPLVDWCNQWNILSHGYQGPQDPLAAARTSIFWLSNNTLNRDGQEYIPLMCSSSKPDVESTNLIGELRFTEDKQVYFYYDNTEYLLYDFDVQVGDTLDIFGGIELYSYSFVEQKTYPHVITKIDTLDDGRLQITSDAIVIFEDGEVGTFEEKQQQIWIEGLGSINGIVHTGINPGIGGNPAIVMLCAYRDDECVYKTDSNDPYWIDYTQLGCVYNEGDFIEGASPILSGLQRTVCKEYYGETEDDNSANSTYKQTFDQMFFENDKPYILCNDYLLREEDNKILIYSQLLNKDLVLYDFTLEVGDSLPALYIDYHARNPMDWMEYNLDVVDYYKSFDGTIYPADTFIVTDISNVTLLDGKEYKKWTFNNGMEYVEGIGSFGNRQWSGDFFQLIANRDVPTSLQGEHLVCVSKNNKLLYQMDDAEMERLGAECLCDYNSGPKRDNAKDGQIGGRPTPTQWNMLEMELRKMENGISILQAETFSYTLEDISQQVNSRTYFQLARQSTKDTATTKSVVGALHFGKEEDNRVYFLRDGVEYVLYDFTAEPGDTLEIFAGINNYPQYSTYTHIVTGKDTIENGACRMLLQVIFPDETTTAVNVEKIWLAGLGSVDGIVHNAAKQTSDAHAAPSRSARSGDTQASIMLCAWREDSCLYTTDHPDYDTFGCVYNQDPTAVETILAPQSSYRKFIRDGQLFILHNGTMYNVIGLEMK